MRTCFRCQFFGVSSAIKSALVAGPAMTCNKNCTSLRVFTEGITINFLKQNKIKWLEYATTCNLLCGSFAYFFTLPFPPPQRFRACWVKTWLHIKKGVFMSLTKEQLKGYEVLVEKLSDMESILLTLATLSRIASREIKRLVNEVKKSSK